MFAGPLFANWPFRGLEPNAYGMLKVDPPWDFSLFSEKGGNKSAQKHYRCLPLDQIKAFPIMDLAAEHCVLWLWATNPMIRQQLECVDAWGFTYKTMGTWNKMTVHGKQAFGTGYVLRSSSEPFIIATRGKPKVAKNIRSSFMAPVGKHSEKPALSFQIAEQLYPGARRVEIFSRTDRPGWEHWGDEQGKFNAR